MSTQSSIENIRNQSKRQMNVSPDSPFNYNKQELDETELRRLKSERVTVLKEETDEIRRQLDFVKNRLGELKKVDSSNSDCAHDILDNFRDMDATDQKLSSETSNEGTNSFKKNRLMTSCERVVHHGKKMMQLESEPSRRPLTGKTDCICGSYCYNCVETVKSSERDEGGLDVYKCSLRHQATSQNEAAIGRNTNCSLEEQPRLSASRFRNNRRRRQLD